MPDVLNRPVLFRGMQQGVCDIIQHAKQTLVRNDNLVHKDTKLISNV